MWFNTSRVSKQKFSEHLFVNHVSHLVTLYFSSFFLFIFLFLLIFVVFNIISNIHIHICLYIFVWICYIEKENNTAYKENLFSQATREEEKFIFCMCCVTRITKRKKVHVLYYLKTFFSSRFHEKNEWFFVCFTFLAIYTYISLLC